jgi:hypothetical protein
MFFKNSLLLALFWTITLPLPANAQSAKSHPPLSDDIVVMTQHLDEVRQPRELPGEVSTCLRDNVCSAALSYIAGAIGIPPNAIRVAQAANLLSGGSTPGSEEARYALLAAPDRRICRVHVVTISVVPADGDRASFFAITAWPDQVQTYTWTPHQALGGGRSWWEGDVFVAQVKSRLYDRYVKAGKCSALPQNGKHFECRGRAACGSADL